MILGATLDSTLASELGSVLTASLVSTFAFGALFSEISFFGAAFTAGLASGFSVVAVLATAGFVFGSLVSFEIRSLLGLGGLAADAGVTFGDTIAGLAACKSSI